LDICDNEGFSPLLAAYSNRHYPICNLLIENGADMNKIAYNNYQISTFDKLYKFSNARQIYENRINFQIGLIPTPIRTPVTRTPIRILFQTQERTRNNEESKEKNQNQTAPFFFIKEYMEMLVQTKKTCPICMEEYKENNVKIFDKCFHNSCYECYSKINKCHYCRIDIK
jgi:hypothetical protein